MNKYLLFFVLLLTAYTAYADRRNVTTQEEYDSTLQSNYITKEYTDDQLQNDIVSIYAMVMLQRWRKDFCVKNSKLYSDATNSAYEKWYLSQKDTVDYIDGVWNNYLSAASEEQKLSINSKLDKTKDHEFKFFEEKLADKSSNGGVEETCTWISQTMSGANFNGRPEPIIISQKSRELRSLDLHFNPEKKAKIASDLKKQYESSINEESECRKTNGEWKRVGMMQRYHCIKPFSDAGKACAGPDDCESKLCVLRKDKYQCYENNDYAGCATLLDSKGRQRRRCID